MTTNFIYPESNELSQIAQDKLPRLVADRIIYRFFPFRDVDAANVSWEQKDNYLGLQQIRGINGAPPRVLKQGGKRYLVRPGVYGEFELIDEQEMTERRPYGSLGGVMDVTDLVLDCQDNLLERRLDRIELLLWTLATTGTYAVLDGRGAIAHTDTFGLQTFSSIVPWSTSATATPLSDFRLAQLKSRGHSVSFGPEATAVMNRTTANQLLSNTNAADIYGRRSAGLGTFNAFEGPNGINALFMEDGLPSIVIYDEGYIDDSGTFQLFVPTGTVVLFGRRPANATVGEYLQTRNMNNPGGAPGAYQKVIDHSEDSVPPSIEVHDGHSGGPAIYFPSAIVVMTVT